MLKTPEQIQNEFHIPANAGQGRAVPRVLFAYAGEDKPQFLATTIAMIEHGALPEFGGKRRAQQPVTQRELAASCGIARPSFTRRLRNFASAPANPMSTEARQRASERMKKNHVNGRRRFHAQAAQRNDGGDQILIGTQGHNTSGNSAHDDSPLSNGACDNQRGGIKNVTLVHRKRRFGAPNLYAYALPERPRAPGDDSEKFFPPSLDQLLANPGFNQIFTAEGVALDREGRPRVQGFKDVPGWIWHASLPATDTERLVMTYYICCGLLDPEKQDRPIYSQGAAKTDEPQVRGEVHPRQSTVAQMLGLSVKQVYLANQFWSGKVTRWGVRRKGATTGWLAWHNDVKAARRDCANRNGFPASDGDLFEVAAMPAVALIRVAHSKPTRKPDGEWKRGPAKIIYLPIRTLTTDEAKQERNRLKALMLKHTGGQEPRGMMLTAWQTAEALLARWTGQERSLRAYWAEVRGLMSRAGVHPALVNELIPIPLE